MKILDLERAINMIARYTPSATVDFDHDEIFVDGPHPDDMRPDERAIVEGCGFKYDERNLRRWRRFA